ncbi:cilia- and flagella-associated protein [Histomonas meleagridis]|uniref:cilia- and flagella-associated protein 57 n=1 Tax=Histomonas meleagridis TaxID=135588 RepID=UPI003559E952|nr:cilia- and flagella-associated protein [Histomonas meleagridis]KAH0806618.1 cilia- and flagella-associated protein 57 [Histomonas meleagridis]
MMVEGNLAFKNVLGLSKMPNPNILFIGEEHAVFPSGNTIVVHNINNRTQKIFLPPEEFSSGVSAIAVMDGKPNVAFGDCSIQPSVCIFDIHTMRPRNFFHLGDDFNSSGFVSLSFSSDGKYLLGQGKEPGYNLVIWDLISNQIITTIKTGNSESPISQCTFSQGKIPFIAVTGQHFLKIYKLEENSLSEVIISNPNIDIITCHLWLNDSLLLCANSNGDIISVNSDPQISVLDVKKDFERRDSAIVSMVPFKKGFIIATESGYLTIFDISSKPKLFTAIRSIPLFTELPISAHSIAIDPTEETAIVTMDKNKLIAVSLSSGEFLLNYEEKPLLMNFHDGAILSCSTCCRKPLVATCGTDKTVRIWNYLDNSLEIVKEFTETVYCVSLHPDGFTILIGFGDKLRLCSIFYDDIRPFREFPIRGCRCAKFSNGGHLFAAVNATKIQIYSTTTFQLINTLHRHSSNVHNLIWGECDTVIASVGNDGAMYIHRQDNINRDENCTTPQVQYTSITSSPDFNSVYICGTDMKLKEIQNGQIVREVLFQIPHTQVVMSNNGQMLFSGTKDGKVYSYNLPIGGEKTFINCHIGAITSMAISFDDSLLFTTGEDGMLCIFNIKDKDNRIHNPERSFFSDEIQTTRAEIEERVNQLKSFEAEKNDLNSSFKMRKNMIENTYKSKDDKKAEEAKKNKDKNRIAYENKKKEKDEVEMSNNEKEKQLTKEWEDKITAQDEEHRKYIIASHNICEQLQKDKENMENEWKQNIQNAQTKHLQILEQLKNDHIRRLQIANNELKEYQEKKKKKILQIEEMKQEILSEKEAAIEATEKQLHEIMIEEEKARTKLQDEHVNKSKECTTFQKLYESQQIERNKLSEQKEKLHFQLSELKKEIDRLKEEIAQKEATIRDRELKIGSVKIENQELEKYHQVLSHQEAMLKQQIGPLNETISKKVSKISMKDGQLENAHKKATEQNETIAEMHKKLQSVIEEERKQTRKLTSATSYFEQAKHDLHEVVQKFHVKDELKSLFETFCAKYVKNQKINDIKLDKFVEEEHKRQKATLQRQLKELKQQHARDEQFQAKEQTKLLMQNAALIEELQRYRAINKREMQNAALTKKGSNTNTSLIPAAEAQRQINENKKKILHLEEQLASYNEVPNSGRNTSTNK